MATKELVIFGPKPAFLHQYRLSGRGMAQIQPPTPTLDPKLINVLCIGVTFNLWVTSDVQFRKEASNPPF